MVHMVESPSLAIFISGWDALLTELLQSRLIMSYWAQDGSYLCNSSTCGLQDLKRVLAG